AGVGIDDSCPEAFHHRQRVLRKGNRLFVTWETATVIAVVEKPHIAANTSTLKGPTLQKLRIIARQRMVKHVAKWRLQRAQQNSNVRNGASHRTGSILLMADRDNSVLRNHAERWLQSDDIF